MERVSTGSAYIGGTLATIYELTRTYQKRLAAVPVGHRNDVVDRGGEGQACVTFPEIHSGELRSGLQVMIAAQTSLDARRRLRDQGANAIAIVLEQADGSALHASSARRGSPTRPLRTPAFRSRWPGKPALSVSES